MASGASLAFEVNCARVSGKDARFVSGAGATEAEYASETVCWCTSNFRLKASGKNNPCIRFKNTSLGLRQPSSSPHFLPEAEKNVIVDPLCFLHGSSSSHHIFGGPSRTFSYSGAYLVSVHEKVLTRRVCQVETSFMCEKQCLFSLSPL